MKQMKDRLKKIDWIRNAFYFLLSLTPHRLGFKLNLYKIEQFDKKWGTDFGGRLYWDEIGTKRERANDYSPSPNELLKTLKSQRIQKTDSIVDMGCGKGFAMYVMSGFPFREIGGVELSSILCDIAKNNLKLVMPAETQWDVFQCDAGVWDGYDRYNIFYMYNPFPKEVMREVKKRIEESVKRRQRDIMVWYLNPEHPDVFTDDSQWKLVKRGTFLKLRHGMHILCYKHLYKCK